MNFSQTFGNRSYSTQNKDSLGSDRLRKAIERNRAKQAKRSMSSSAPAKPTVVSKVVPRKPEVVSAARKTVARPENFEFSSTLRETGVKTPTRASYQVSRGTSSKPVKVVSSSTKTVKRKSRVTTKSSHSNKYLLRGVWVLVGALILRLIFSSGGVLDYFSQLDKLKQTENRLAMIHEENTALNQEIEQIKTDAKYQKKLIRDHLGFISKNEYIVLFSKSN